MSSNVIEDAVNVFTDGSSISTPRRQGGAALRIVVVNDAGNEEVTDIPLIGFRGATNQQMELYACIEAVKEAQRHPALDRMRRIAIHTDSMYVVGNYDRARFDWSRNGWRNRYGKAMSNAPQWKELVKVGMNAPKKVEFHWTKGHAKDEHNKAADKMAQAAAKAASRSPLSIVNVRRKTTEKSVELGSVGVHGQRFTIRVIVDEYLPLQRLYKYKYEVVSPKSPYRGNVDIIFSLALMSAGHTYYVLVNDNPKNPTVLKVIREVSRRGAATDAEPARLAEGKTEYHHRPP